MNYYNEFDPKAAAWLRELIKAGEIPSGDVDTRSITEISPHELTGYTQQHFFAGIGGWPLALKLAGWPANRPVRTGSCPCQPFSNAGLGLGTADSRHLWPVFRDLIAFGSPTVTFGEQVASAAGRLWLAGVRADLEDLGYAVGAADLCAAGVGAPHRRQRLYWVADAHGCRFSRRKESYERAEQPGQHAPRWIDALRCGDAGRWGDSDRSGLGQQCGALAISPQQPAAELRGNDGYWSDFDLLPCTDGKTRRIEPGTFPLANGVSGRVGLLRGYGNAIVPQVAAEFIGAYIDAIGGRVA